MSTPRWPDHHEDDLPEEDVSNSEGFCPGCAQPRFNGVILHQPHCPFGNDCYDRPEDDY